MSHPAPIHPTPPATTQPASRTLGPWVWLLVLGLLAARWLYLAFLCPYSLVEDEAQYWEWSKHLSLSYYTKGPGIAWTIAAATALLGDTELAVRFAAPLFSALLTLAGALLVLRITDDRPKALLAAAALQLAPTLQATALLATIDGPYCACWALAALSFWIAIDPRRLPDRRAPWWAWPAVGAALGVGFLYKYTILLLVPGLIAFAWWSRRAMAGAPHADHPPRPVSLGPIVAAAFFLAFSSPVLIWNQDHDWPTVSHLLGHLGFVEARAGITPAPPPAPPPAGTRAWSPLWSLEFLGTQLGMVGPLLLLALLACARLWRARLDPARRGEVFLALCGLPILLFYLLVSLVAEPEGNWPMGAYVTLLPLAAIAAADAMAQTRARRAAGNSRRETPGHTLWNIGVVYGLVAGVLMLRVDLLARLPAVGGYIPVARLTQGQDLAASVQTIREQLLPTYGWAPVVAAHYGRASQLAFYLPGRPKVYCASSLLGGRPTQHDYWPTHNLLDLNHATPVLLIGGDEAIWRRLYRNVEPLGPVPGQERKRLNAFLGRDHLHRGPN